MGMTLTVGIAIVCVGLVAISFFRYRDTLHPALTLGPMLFFLYAYMPFHMSQDGGLSGYLTPDFFEFVQWVGLAGVVAIAVGVLLGSRQLARPGDPLGSTSIERRKLITGAVVVGAVGVIGYIATLVGVGGFEAAYGKSYGGGYSDSGYVRELLLWPLPALLWLTFASRTMPRSPMRLMTMLLFAAPLAIQATLGARRGPTFMLASALVFSFYIVRNRRPRLVTLAGGAVVLGFFVIFLVTNRDRIYLGSQESLEQNSSSILEANAGNEFIYSAGTILHTNITGNFTWGARYLVTVFVRPIPRSIWPTKYDDAARWFGTANMEENLGTDGRAFAHTLGWEGTVGASPGLIADMWLELSWGCVVVLFGIGWVYGKFWRLSVDRGEIYSVLYILLLSLSMYLVMQTLEAALYRFLFMSAPALALWKISREARVARTRLVPMPVVTSQAS
jgi:hypothetical protein